MNNKIQEDTHEPRILIINECIECYHNYLGKNQISICALLNEEFITNLMMPPNCPLTKLSESKYV